MQTYEEQIQHYRAVRARILAAAIKEEPIGATCRPQSYAPALPPPTGEQPPHVKWGVPRLPPRARAICVKVCERTGVQFSDMASAKRSTVLVKARQRAFFALSRCGHSYSLPTIGRWFGGRDHTTVLHGIRRHEASLKERCL